MTAFLFAQDDTPPTLEEIRAARKTMDMIEKDMVKTSADKQAAAIILEDKHADEAAYLYLVQVPGYQDAVASKSILEFKKQVKSDDKVYRKLAKEAMKTQDKKETHLASINSDYMDALRVYNEATK